MLRHSATHSSCQPQVFAIFQQAQHNTASHRKLVHALHDLVTSTEASDSFIMAIIHCFNVILGVRGNEDVAIRSLRLLLGFIVWSGERDDVSVLLSSGSQLSPTARLIERLMLHAVNGLEAKDRIVRLRCCQLLVACVNAIDELSDNVWSDFRSKMTERLFDRHASVRVQAIHAMARLQSLPVIDGQLDANGSERFIRDVFIDHMSHDPSPDVRRAALLNLDVIPGITLDAIIDRRRDVDPAVRRALYSKKMEELEARFMSISQRNKFLLSGLSDRDKLVRKSCIEVLFGRWIQNVDNNLIKLIFTLDVVINTRVAEAALLSFYELAPNIFSTPFSPAYFENLTPETAIALRVFCCGRKELAQDILPDLTVMAGHIRRIYELLVSTLGSSVSPCPPNSLPIDQESIASSIAEYEFMIKELFSVVNLLDKSDEAGRRAVQSILLEMLSNLELGHAVFTSALELMSSLSPGLISLIDTVGQLIGDLHSLSTDQDMENPDLSEDHDLRHSLESLCIGNDLGKDVRIMSQIRCLEVVCTLFGKVSRRDLLESSQSDPDITVKETVDSLINEIVIPAINSSFAAVQERGLHALTIASSVSLTLSQSYIDLFIDFFRLGVEDIRHTSVHAAFDLLCIHGDESLVSSSSDGGSQKEPISTQIISSLYDKDPELQAIAAEGYAKLFLHKLTTDLEVLGALFQLYVHPGTSSNNRLRQTLAYFFQAFSYSSIENQLLLAKAAFPHLRDPSFVPQLVDLCDHANLVTPIEGKNLESAHVYLGEACAWSALEEVSRKTEPPSTTKERSVYTTIISRLRIDLSWPGRSLKRLLFIVGQLIRVVTDKPTLTALKRVVAILVELDDPNMLLEKEDLDEMRGRLESLNLTNRVPKKIAGVHRRPEPAASTTSLAGGGGIPDVMDDIAELLEED